MKKINRAGVDIAKSVFHVHGVDCHGQVVWQAKLKRHLWIKALCKHLEPGAEVGMEACAGAHHWARELQRLGYRVKLIAAQFVKPYVKSNKNDQVDAEAICEAMSRRCGSCRSRVWRSKTPRQCTGFAQNWSSNARLR